MPIEFTGLSTTNQIKTTDTTEVKVKRSEPTVAQQETESGKITDTVTLTDIALKMKNLENVLFSYPVIDSQRVDNIKTQIDQGVFEVDPDRTAEKFLEFELQLAS